MLNKTEVIEELKKQKDAWIINDIPQKMSEFTIRGFICGYEFSNQQIFNEDDFFEILNAVMKYGSHYEYRVIKK